MKFSLWSKHPGSEKQSVTMTLLVIGFIFCLAKLMLSDMIINGYHFPLFSGSDFALAISALGGLYSLRRFSDSRNNKNVNITQKIDIEKEENRN